MLTGTKDERHNLIYAGVFPMLKEQTSKNKQTSQKNKNPFPSSTSHYLSSPAFYSLTTEILLPSAFLYYRP